MLLTIQDIGKYGGLKAQDGNFYSPSKFAKNLPKFEVNKSYECEVKTSEKDGKVYRNIMAAKEVLQGNTFHVSLPAAPAAAVTPKTEAPKPVVEKKAPKAAAKAVAFGRELSDYEILKDKRIGVAGVVQAVIQSPIYQLQAELMEPAAVDKFLADKAEFWLGEIKRLSEK